MGCSRGRADGSAASSAGACHRKLRPRGAGARGLSDPTQGQRHGHRRGNRPCLLERHPHRSLARDGNRGRSPGDRAGDCRSRFPRWQSARLDRTDPGAHGGFPGVAVPPGATHLARVKPAVQRHPARLPLRTGSVRRTAHVCRCAAGARHGGPHTRLWDSPTRTRKRRQGTAPPPPCRATESIGPIRDGPGGAAASLRTAGGAHDRDGSPVRRLAGGAVAGRIVDRAAAPVVFPRSGRTDRRRPPRHHPLA